jgi:tRNA dimethylallyltransferase
VAKQRVIPIICGPTASGKTDLALALAAQFPVEIISADSRQLVRHLNIGTAKPTAEDQARVPFHLIDLIEPGDRYSAYRFIVDAESAINDILARDRYPILVGGTGLYLRALTEGVVEIEQSDVAIREQLERQMETLGPEIMHARLNEVDPPEAARTHANNRVRVIRALEIYLRTGIPRSRLRGVASHRKSDHAYAWFCLMPDRALLYERINRRVDAMMQAGLLAELERLIQAGMIDRVRAARIIGYHELLDYLDGRVSLAEAVSIIKQNSRRYAKRQMTWFRKQVNCAVFAQPESLLSAVSILLREAGLAPKKT